MKWIIPQIHTLVFITILQSFLEWRSLNCKTPSKMFPCKWVITCTVDIKRDPCNDCVCVLVKAKTTAAAITENTIPRE